MKLYHGSDREVMDIQNINPEALESVYKEHLEADIISLIAERFEVEPTQAMNLYYQTKLSQQINDGTYGIQYLNSSNLLEDLLVNEAGLFPLCRVPNVV
jgi:hypothetical protein